LNLELQRALNPASRSGETLTRFETTFAVGDKVMQVENDYEKDVYNGDVGFVRSIDLAARVLECDFDARAVAYGFDELDRLVLAYAITVHKSQGSEYPAVVIPITTQHFPMLKRNLLYTGVTRGKKLVVLIGQREALAMCVTGEGQGRRWSKLRDWLAGVPTG
jgi:exodeoxyribonuclease V alpha subunit